MAKRYTACAPLSRYITVRLSRALSAELHDTTDL